MSLTKLYSIRLGDQVRYRSKAGTIITDTAEGWRSVAQGMPMLILCSGGVIGLDRVVSRLRPGGVNGGEMAFEEDEPKAVLK
jgi:hypothetical protein